MWNGERGICCHADNVADIGRVHLEMCLKELLWQSGYND